MDITIQVGDPKWKPTDKEIQTIVSAVMKVVNPLGLGVAYRVDSNAMALTSMG